MTPEVSQVHLHETGAGQECLTSGFILMSRGLSGEGRGTPGRCVPLVEVERQEQQGRCAELHCTSLTRQGKPLESLMHRHTQDLHLVHFRIKEILKICYINEVFQRPISIFKGEVSSRQIQIFFIGYSQLFLKMIPEDSA